MKISSVCATHISLTALVATERQRHLSQQQKIMSFSPIHATENGRIIAVLLKEDTEMKRQT